MKVIHSRNTITCSSVDQNSPPRCQGRLKQVLHHAPQMMTTVPSIYSPSIDLVAAPTENSEINCIIKLYMYINWHDQWRVLAVRALQLAYGVTPPTPLPHPLYYNTHGSQLDHWIIEMHVRMYIVHELILRAIYSMYERQVLLTHSWVTNKHDSIIATPVGDVVETVTGLPIK